MWIVSSVRSWRARRSRSAFTELSRDDQVQAMRNREGRGTHHGSREAAKHHGSGFLGQKLGPP